jgi:chromosome segregation ATPase
LSLLSSVCSSCLTQINFDHSEREQSAQLAARLKEVEANLSKSGSDCAGLSKALADARTDKETSVAELTKAAAEEAAKLEAACKEAAATAARMVEERDSALAHVFTLTSEAVTLKTEAVKVAGLNVTLQELTEKRANEMTELEKLRVDNEKLVADVAELTKKLAAAASDNKKLVTKMSSVESASKHKVTLAKDADAKATGLQIELDAATAKAEDLKSKLNALEKEAAQIQAGMKQHIEAAAEQLTAKALADAKTEWDAKLQTQVRACHGHTCVAVRLQESRSTRFASLTSPPPCSRPLYFRTTHSDRRRRRGSARPG